jgi:small multidrug resistance pump
MKFLPMGTAYASYAGLVIFGTFLLSILKFGQSPNIFAVIGCTLIVIGIILVNSFGK